MNPFFFAMMLMLVFFGILSAGVWYDRQDGESTCAYIGMKYVGKSSSDFVCIDKDGATKVIKIKQ